MFVVTMHSFDGSSGEAAQPEAAWVFSTEQEADDFCANFEDRCGQLNPQVWRDHEFMLNVTEIANGITATPLKTNDELFDEWLDEEEPDWLNLDPVEMAQAVLENHAGQQWQARIAAVEAEYKKICTGCQGKAFLHSHMPAWAIREEAELAAVEAQFGLTP